MPACGAVHCVRPDVRRKEENRSVFGILRAELSDSATNAQRSYQVVRSISTCDAVNLFITKTDPRGEAARSEDSFHSENYVEIRLIFMSFHLIFLSLVPPFLFNSAAQTKAEPFDK